MKSLTIFYHVAALNEWKAVVVEQLNALKQSGIIPHVHGFLAVINGNESDRTWLELAVAKLNLPDFQGVVLSDLPMETGETPTLLKIQDYCKTNSEHAILYIHTKGVAHNKTRKRNMEEVWRWKLMKTLLSEWKANLETLETKDLCGWNWSTEARYPQYFPGNMWFANAAYIATLPDFLSYQKTFKSRTITDAKHPRFAAMFWLGLGIKRADFRKKVESLELVNKSFHTYFSDLYIRKAQAVEFAKERRQFDCLLSIQGDDEKLLNYAGNMPASLQPSAQPAPAKEYRIQSFAIVHNQDLLLARNAEYSKLENFKWLVVSENPQIDKLQGLNNVIVCAHLPENIEGKKELLHYTAYYALLKNALIDPETDYIRIIEYDCKFAPNIESYKKDTVAKLGKFSIYCHEEHSISSCWTTSPSYLIEPCRRALNAVYGLSIEKLTRDSRKRQFMCCTNFVMSRQFFADFMEYAAGYVPFLENEYQAGNAFERLFTIYCMHKGINWGKINGCLNTNKNSHGQSGNAAKKGKIV